MYCCANPGFTRVRVHPGLSLIAPLGHRQRSARVFLVMFGSGYGHWSQALSENKIWRKRDETSDVRARNGTLAAPEMKPPVTWLSEGFWARNVIGCPVGASEMSGVSDSGVV